MINDSIILQWLDRIAHLEEDMRKDVELLRERILHLEEMSEQHHRVISNCHGKPPGNSDIHANKF